MMIHLSLPQLYHSAAAAICASRRDISSRASASSRRMPKRVNCHAILPCIPINETALLTLLSCIYSFITTENRQRGRIVRHPQRTNNVAVYSSKGNAGGNAGHTLHAAGYTVTSLLPSSGGRTTNTTGATDPCRQTRLSGNPSRR